jgi:hypothetical protein
MVFMAKNFKPPFKWRNPVRRVPAPFPGGKAEVKEKVELYLYSPFWAFIACYRGSFTFTFISPFNWLKEILKIRK